MVAVVVVLTEVVVMENVAVVAPLDTVTLTGTVTAELSLDSVTAAPPVRAAPFNVTVPVEFAAATTDVGFALTEETCSGSTVRGAETVPL